MRISPEKRERTGSLQDQAKKSIGWMPWHQLPKKDAAICEKPRGAESGLRASDIRMGKPARRRDWHHEMNP